jgi:TolA-binding protein
MQAQRGIITTSRVARVASAVVAAAVLLLGGCAYFNTFYNAKAEFRRGEEERKVGGTGDAAYQKSIEKCQLLLRYYSKSKYVDDALFLMGMARFHRQEYVQSRAAFEDLFERFPKSEYIERARYWNGYAALRQGDTGAAAQAFDRLAKEFPESKLNIEAVFRQAEAQLDARDYDRAREELRAFMAAHPKSNLAAEAQLRLARTYHDERRYADARSEYERVLTMDVSDAVRYEVQLNSALVLRAIAEEVLSDPALQPAEADSGAVGDSAAAATTPPLNAQQEAGLSQAQAQIEEVWNTLQSTRKQAAKLGKQVEHDIELAVTRALRGDRKGAIEDLDQIARTRPKSAISSRARYEIGEIHRRSGDLVAARTAYDEAARETNAAPTVAVARKKSSAIASREMSRERLATAPAVLQRWHALGGTLPNAVAASLDAALADTAAAVADSAVASATPADSLAARLTLASDFEALAAEQLRVAEIDLLDLDQPLVALREFERVLTHYADSAQAPRAAFAIAWIYDYRLRDRTRARGAYENVAQAYPATAQGRAAQDILAHWDDPDREVQDPFSRP